MTVATVIFVRNNKMNKKIRTWKDATKKTIEENDKVLRKLAE